MASCVPGLYAAGELAGGANGANRLSGNALPEALVFGERAGERAARFAARRKAPTWNTTDARPQVELIRAMRGQNEGGGPSPIVLMSELKELMWHNVGPFRTARALSEAHDRICTLRERELPLAAVTGERVHNASLVEWFELRNGLLAAEALALSALNRRESRGAHQRDDFPESCAAYEKNQRLSLADGTLVSSFGGMQA
jgi:succinate dehydrogenase/fumarate reductase flavoprotein subunit